jgi:hypothetical protein
MIPWISRSGYSASTGVAAIVSAAMTPPRKILMMSSLDTVPVLSGCGTNVPKTRCNSKYRL